MMPFEHLLWVVPLCLGMGMIFSETVGKWNRKTGEIKIVDKYQNEEKEDTSENEETDFMTLRNGYGVTKDRNPTFAEQWVNIMNYSGENQLEGDYDEIERNNSTKRLG